MKANQRQGKGRCKTCYEKKELLRKILKFFRAKTSLVQTQHCALQTNKRDWERVDDLQKVTQPISWPAGLCLESRPPGSLSHALRVLALESVALSEHQGNKHEPLVLFSPAFFPINSKLLPNIQLISSTKSSCYESWSSTAGELESWPPRVNRNLRVSPSNALSMHSSHLHSPARQQGTCSKLN